MTGPRSQEPAASRRAVAAVELAALLRPELEELRAYLPHDPPGIRIKLDANEAPPASSPAIRDAVLGAIAKVAFERYPDPRATALKEAIARRTGADPDALLLGVGSDEVIALLLTAFARPRDRAPQAVVMMPTPTFAMYRLSARGHGVKPVEVPLDAGWDLDVAMTKRAIAMMRPNLVFLASPNNPTGNRFATDRLREVVSADSSVFSIVDEAYVDYADGSLRAWREELPNVGFLRTLSKIGVAALRVGWLEADPALVAEIDKIRLPYNLSSVAQAAATAVLDEAWDEIQADVAAVVARREELARALGAMEGFVVTPSASNFLWVKTPGPAQSVYDGLVERGILVRSFHGAGGRLGAQLRITIGTDAENEALVSALAALREVP